MKPYLQAKPQLRGPNGLRNWYAQLPLAAYDQESTAILPIGGLLAPFEQAVGSASASARQSWLGGLFFTGLLSLLLKKSYHKNANPVALVPGPWLRRVLGLVVVLLGALAGSVAQAQPTVLASRTENGTYKTYNLTASLTGAAAQAPRILAATSFNAGVSADWAFTAGNSGAANYAFNWRPYDAGQQIPGYNQVIDPATASGSARYNGGGGQDGRLPAVTSGRRYTYNISRNSSGGNFNINQHMAVLETTYNPVAINALEADPAGATVPYGSAVTVKANLSGTFNNGEHFYLRYVVGPTSGFGSNGTVVAMTVSGSTATGIIPANALSYANRNQTVNYYVFSSPNAANATGSSAVTNASADLLTLNTSATGSFRYQQATFSSVTQFPVAGAVRYGAPVTVTATLSAAPGPGEFVYLRYSTAANFSSSTTVAMDPTAVSNVYTATIPNQASTGNLRPNIFYYALTSTDANAANSSGNIDDTTLQRGRSGTDNFSYNYTPTAFATTAPVTQSPANDAVPYGGTVTVTTTLASAATTSEFVYLRYGNGTSTDFSTNCGVVAMTAVAGSGNTRFTGVIPDVTTTATPTTTTGTTPPNKPPTVFYQVFTSPATTAPTCANAGAQTLVSSSTLSFDYGIGFASVSVPTEPTNCTNLITAVLNAAPSTRDFFYLRYTNNPNGDFGVSGSTTATLAMTVSGTMASVLIPSQAPGTIVPGTVITYYVYSSSAGTAQASNGGINNTGLRYGLNTTSTGPNFRFVTPAALSIGALTAVSATCADGNDGAVTFAVSGGSPGAYSFEISDNVGNTFQAAMATNPSAGNYRIGGLTAGRTYRVRVTDGCETQTSAAPSAAIGFSNPRPTATLTNGGPVCTGSSTTVSVALTGSSPWSLTYTYLDETNQLITVTQNGITTSPYTIDTGELNANRTYNLTQLSDGNGCTATGLPLSTTVTVNTRPTITLNPINSVCAGTSAVLTGTLTGAGPWTIFYKVNGGNEVTANNIGSLGQTTFTFSFSTTRLTNSGVNTITITNVRDRNDCLKPTSVSQNVTVTPSTTWTGAVSNVWSAPGNWTNCVPSQFLDALIPGSLPAGRSYPSFVSGATLAEVKDLTIEAGASLTYSAGTLGIFGNLANAGTLALSQTSGTTITGTKLCLRGTASQTISGLSMVHELVVNTTGGATATLGNNLAVTGSLTATSGILLTGANTISLTAEQTTATEGTATISETNLSFVRGQVRTTRNLSAAGTPRSFGGLGLRLLPSGAVLPGLTTATRYTGTTALTGVGSSQGITRWFRVVPTVDAGLNVELTFSYFDHERNNISPADLTLFSTPSGSTPPTGPWTTYRSSVAVAPTGTGAGTVSVGGLSHLSDWTLGSRLSPLPVELTRFEATRASTDAALTWATASEQNSRGFEVEVSIDGQTFRRLGFVPSAAGNSHSARTYAYRDQEPGKAGARYYRLRQIDTDGTASFSPVRVVSFTTEAPVSLLAGLSAAPNPFGARLTLSVRAPQAGAARFSIMDVTGRLVRSELLTLPAGASKVELSGLESLPAGVYLLQLPLGGRPQHLRLVKE